MLLTLIFGVLAVVLVVAAETAPGAKANPMLRVGGWFIGVAFGLVGLVFLLAAL